MHTPTDTHAHPPLSLFHSLFLSDSLLKPLGRIVENSLGQAQPEAVAFDFSAFDTSAPRGKGLWHISEQGGGYQPLEYVRCKDRVEVRDTLPLP